MWHLKINKLFIISLLTFSNLSLINANKNIDTINHDKWDVFNNIFIEKAKLQATSRTNKAIKLLDSIAIGSIFWILLSKYLGAISFERFVKPVASDSVLDITKHSGFFYSTKKLIFTAIPSLFITRFTYRKMNAWTLAHEEQEVIKTYIENWESNKDNTPAELYNLFDNTYSQYKTDQKKVDFAEIARIVKAFIDNKNNKDAASKNE